MGLGTPEIILIFLAILLIFGAKRIPEIARGLGKGIKEFKDATTEIKREIDTSDSPRPRVQTPQQTTTPRREAYQTQEEVPAQTSSTATSGTSEAEPKHETETK